MSGNTVYVLEDGAPVGVRIAGKLLPVVSETDVDVRFNDNAITRVTLTVFAPAIETVVVREAEVAALQSELSCGEGGSK